MYALDARNHGDSPHSDNFSVPLMCEDVKHFMKSQDIERAVFIGHSMGGRTAMKLALMEVNFYFVWNIANIHNLSQIWSQPISMEEGWLSNQVNGFICAVMMQ